MRHVLVVLLAVLTLGSVRAKGQDCAGPEPSACPLLDTAKVIFAGRVTENDKESLTTTFQVTELFKGSPDKIVNLSKGLHEFHFEVGKQYLVFAVPCIWQGADKHCLMNGICSSTRVLENAAALVQQLRAEKNGERIASVYGMLLRMPGDGRGERAESYQRPLPNVTVRLKSDATSFETRTDPQGAYAFSHLPSGRKYQVSADLPPELELGNVIGDGPVEPFELPRNCCFENNLYALPSGRIRGAVVGPDGRPLPSVAVSLFPASRYESEKQGDYSYQGRHGKSGESRGFEFYHLLGDDYVVVINPRNEEDPDAPFATTFYPHAAKIEEAQAIHLADGQQFSGADIHVSNPQPTREVDVRLLWGDREAKDFYPANVIVKASRGRNPYSRRTNNDSFKINVLLNARYTVRAEAFCRMGTKGKTETDDVIVDESDSSVVQVELKFSKGGCTR
jgi:hypothetical protein